MNVRKSVVKILRRPRSDLKVIKRSSQVRKKLAFWAADCAEHVLSCFKKEFPKDKRPRNAIRACRKWATTGTFKMSVIRKASLDSHAAARKAIHKSAAQFAARAAGHAVGTAHVPAHALGASVYAIRARFAYSGDFEDAEKEFRWQMRRLSRYAAND